MSCRKGIEFEFVQKSEIRRRLNNNIFYYYYFFIKKIINLYFKGWMFTLELRFRMSLR